MTRIDELLGKIEEHRAQLSSRGILSDPSREEAQLLKLIDELAFIVKGQFDEINKLKQQVRRATK